MEKNEIQEGDFINLNPPRLFIFEQNQNNINDVRIIIDKNDILLHYPSDDIITFKNIDEEIIKNIRKNKKMEIFEIKEFSGYIKEVYIARL